MYRVFISHSSKDRRWAKLLKQLLADAKASIYVAEFDLSPGNSISDDVIKEIKRCNLFILLWSKKSKKSSYVEKEIFLAKSEEKKILPVMIQPRLQLTSLLGDIKYLDVNEEPEEALSWLKEYVASSADQKAVSDLIGLALMAFLGWALLKGES